MKFVASRLRACEEIGQARKTTLRQRRAWFEAALREAPHHEVRASRGPRINSAAVSKDALRRSSDF
jgi:hypothetical protein